MNVQSTLDAVTVYARGALCTRRAKLTGPASHEVRVTGLPLSLHAGSLRARAAGGDVKVLDVRPGYDVELAPEADVPAEQKACEAAERELNRLGRELQRLEREIAEVSKLKPVFPGQKASEPPRSAPVAAMLEAAAFVDRELGRRFEARRALNQQLEDATNELELRRRRLSEASASVRTERARLSRVAVVTLSGAASDVELSVDYFVPGARWAPSYALQLDRGMGKGVLAMRASVAQCTGEDWSQVKLSLSTAALDRRTALPELKSLRIGRAQPPPQRSGWREPPPGLDELFGGFDAAWNMRPRPPPASPMAYAAPIAPPSSGRGQGAPRKKAAQERERDAAPMLSPAPLPPPMLQVPMNAPPVGAMPASASGARMSMAQPAMAMRRSRGFFGGGESRSLEEPAEEQAEGVSAAVDELSEVTGSFDVGSTLDEDAPTDSRYLPELAARAAQIEPAADLMDYGNLVMPGPGDGRGRLRAAPDAGVAFLAAMHVKVDVLLAVVATSAQRANAVEHLALPPRAAAPSGGSFDYRYDCAARVDVPSNGQWTVVPVAQADVGLTAQYACVPSVEPQVYRTLRIHNRSKHALLRGPVDVTLGDEFLLTADLPLIAPGAADARLGLGVEEAIKVARKTHFKETTGGLLGGSTVLTHDVEVVLNNRLPHAASVEVRERVPFSEDEDVKVEEAAVKPAWEKDEEPRDGVRVRGARAWKVSVPAGEKHTLTAQFVVRIPSDKMVVGGNRRG